MNTHPTFPAEPLPTAWMLINSSAAIRRESFLEGHLAAAREKLDCAVAGLLEAATDVVSQDALLRKALAEGEQRERRRLQAILLHRIEMHPFENDSIRGELLQLLEAVGEP